MARSGSVAWQPLAEHRRRQAGGDDARGRARRRERGAGEAAGEREGEELGAVADFGGEAEDEGGDGAGRRGAALAGSCLRPDQAGGAGEEQGERDQQRSSRAC